MPYFLIFFLCLGFFFAEGNELPLPSEEPEHLIITNRIVAKVGEKTISMMDVVKKMNVFFTRHYPDLVSSKVARYQFYSSSWRGMLKQMIDTELILADAEKIELKINDAEVREKLQERFGPNVMTNLEQLGITYEEAREMIRSELTVQRMTWYRVNSKAILSINPQDVRQAYKQYCAQNPPTEEWKYQSLSIRAEDTKKAEALAEKAYHLLSLGKEGLAAVAEKLQQEASDASISLSPEYEATEKNISDSHKQVLHALGENAYSKPIAQVSRDKSIVQRIFYLKEHAKKVPPPFESQSDKIEDSLIEYAIEKETELYIAKLKNWFSCDENSLQEMIPADFEPFALK